MKKVVDAGLTDEYNVLLNNTLIIVTQKGTPLAYLNACVKTSAQEHRRHPHRPVMVLPPIVAGLEINRDTELRNIGYMFQNYVLFSNMTRRENIFYGLKMRHTDKETANAQVDERIDTLSLKEVGDNPPVTQLSGGQRQRVSQTLSTTQNTESSPLRTRTSSPAP